MCIRDRKNPDNTDAIECSEGAIRIPNRILDLPEAYPDIHRSAQLLRSSEIGPIDHQRSRAVGPSRGGLPGLLRAPSHPGMGPPPTCAGGLSDLSPSSVGVGRTDGYQGMPPGGLAVVWGCVWRPPSTQSRRNCLDFFFQPGFFSIEM